MMTVSITRYASKANWSWLKHAQLPRTHHRSLLRIHFAGQDLHERGFARAVGPGQAIALARRERRGNFVEQNFSAVAHGHITD